MNTEALLNTKTSILVGGFLAVIFLFSNPSTFKIGTSLSSNFHFSTRISNEEPITIQFGPESLHISIPAATPAVAQPQIELANLPAIEDSATLDIQISSLEVLVPQQTEIAPQIFSVPTLPITNDIPVSISLAPTIPEISVPTIEMVVAPSQQSTSVPAIEPTVEAAIEQPTIPVVIPVILEATIPAPTESLVQEGTPPIALSDENPEIPSPMPAVLGVATTEENQCHPSYSGCLKIDASDYDCEGGSGNGPFYTGKVQVIGPDVFGLDRNKDGWGCE